MRTRIGGEGLLHDDNRAIVVLKDNHRSYRANNQSRLRLLCYRIDGEMIREGERCDFGMGIPGRDTVYLIELKGTHMRKAARQIFSTMQELGDKLRDYTINGRIVLSRVPRPDLRSSDMINLERQIARTGGNVLRATHEMKETI